MPSMGTSPTVGFKAYSAARLAGVIRDPIVSVPMASALKPDDTLTAEPVDEPPGAESSQCSFFFAICLATYGDWHCPPTADQPGGIDGFFNPQNSVRLDLPSMIRPLLMSRSTIVAFFFGVHPTKANDPSTHDSVSEFTVSPQGTRTDCGIHAEICVRHDIVFEHYGNSVEWPSPLSSRPLIVQSSCNAN